MTSVLIMPCKHSTTTTITSILCGALLVSCLKCGLWSGHNGSAVLVNADELSDEAKTAMAAGWKKYGHNEYVNRMISVRRSLPDVRDSA